MSTNACIAKPKVNGWEGVYHHSDGYPTGLGPIIWNLVKNRYHGDVTRFYHEIIDNNFDGWSHLSCFHPEWGDPRALRRWNGQNTMTVDGDRRRDHTGRNQLPVSYKNDPERSSGETSCPYTSDDSDLSFIPWVYVVHEKYLEILRIESSGNDIDDCSHVSVGKFQWDEPEPNWDQIENKFTDVSPA